VNLIPFSKQYLRLHEALPFGLRSADGRLLLAAGARIERRRVLDDLLSTDLYADEHESAEWRRSLSGAVDAMIRQNASLSRIAGVRPDVRGDRSVEHALAEQWSDVVLVLDAALRDAGAGGAWLARAQSAHERALKLAERRLDASLYHLIYTAGHSMEHYSCHHALLCLVIVRQVAATLGWDAATIARLGLAALTMNASMRRLQDLLAVGERPLNAEMRAAIDTHAERSAQMLQAAGLDDAVCEGIVRAHHDDRLRDVALDRLDPVQQGARALRRVDVFAAKLSRRATRAPMSPVQAAREACLGADGTPDPIGAALLKSVGLYPPGSFVALANGELGIVIARGRRANLPIVAALVGSNGSALGVPVVRDAIEPRFAVKSALPSSAVKVRPSHEQLMALR
jgi:HD-GYP domain-containing protein (c-di-GMP phosphodiesterase class II)